MPNGEKGKLFCSTLVSCTTRFSLSMQQRIQKNTIVSRKLKTVPLQDGSNLVVREDHFPRFDTYGILFSLLLIRRVN